MNKPKLRDIAILLLVVASFVALTVYFGSSVLIIDRRAPTANEVTQIQVAIEAYDSEYSEMPDASNNSRLITILSGDNPRHIEFLEIKPSQLNPDRQVVDEWGTPLRITIHSHTKIRVTSAGRDQVFGTADDITNQ